MLLSSLEVRNFRSLEYIKLDELSQFNVFIGRNNAGKSTILGALQFLAATAFRFEGNYNRPDDASVLTAHDLARVLSYRLEFQPSVEERAHFVDLMIAAGYGAERRENTLDGAFLTRLAYRFAAPAGLPSQVKLHEVLILAEDETWASMLRISNENVPETSGYIGSYLFHQEAISQLGLLTADALQTVINSMGQMGLPFDLYGTREDVILPEPFSWLRQRLVTYFTDGYYFSPFRHSLDHAYANASPRLAPDGSNLPVVLNYLSGRNRSRFRRIEDFLHDAVPEVGTLNPGLVASATQGMPSPQSVEITFESADSYEVRLKEMGGGIEQLLMVATTLATVDERATLFLEEPELHLHPGAQRYLIERIRAESRQIFITTHSPVFVNQRAPRSLYRVEMNNGRTTASRVEDAAGLAELMDDIGARNSDVLLSDAVLFLEGSTDREIVENWARTLDMNLDEHNVVVIAMGGGRNAEHQAPARSQVLEEISGRAPVPHLFLLDRDERRQAELERLQGQLGERLCLLTRREIENYLLVPRAILAALEKKYHHNADVLDRVQAADQSDIKQLVQQAAASLYGQTLLKRIKVEVGGLKDGLLPSEQLGELTSQVASPSFLTQVGKVITDRVDSVVSKIDLDALIQRERETLDAAWSDPDQQLCLAPGAEILEHVFRHFGARFDKRNDSPRIAAEMSKEEIDPEIDGLIERVTELAQ